MASTKFYAIQSDNEDEVKFLLGLTSILQFDFNHDAEIFIQTSNNIDSLVNLFNWKKKPATGSREISADEIYLNLWGKEAPANSSKSILSSEFPGSENARYVPKHLLQSQIKSEAILISQCWTVARVIHENKFSTSAPTRRLSFVFSSDVKEWISLLEANDALIARWYRERDEKTELTLVDVSRGVQADAVGKTAFSSDYVIISKISLSTTQFIKSVRSINPDIKLIIHAFESPSVYFANTFLYDLKDYLYEDDLWLMSCEADKKLAGESFSKINSQVFPLKKPDIFLNTKQVSSLKHILYFGRISEQKNLHEAIVAVSLIADEMRVQDRKFKIFGYEDFLGLPHLRIPSLGYLEMLYKLTKKLGISDIVEFHPAIPQTKIDDVLKEGIFLSTSFHSDENFGLVAHRALNLGIPVVLSDWGGHKDFQGRFANINYVPVYEFRRTPHLNPFELSQILLEIWTKKSPEKKPLKQERVNFPEGNSRDLLKPSDLKIGIEKRIIDSHPWAQRRWPLYGKIFKSFSDDNYRKANLLYGALKIQKMPGTKNSLVSPFVKITDQEIKILDCTTGVLRYSRKANPRNIQLKQLGKEQQFLLSLPEWTWLWENGHIYSKGEL